MDNKLVTIAVSLAVAVIVIGGLLVPVIGDAEKSTSASYTNFSSHYSSKVSKDVSGSLASTILTVDGEAVTGLTNRCIIWSDSGIISMLNSLTCNINYIDGGTVKSAGYVNGFDYSIDYDTKTISVSNITYSNSTTTPTSLSWTYEDICFYASTTGDYADQWVVGAVSITLYDKSDLYYAMKIGTNLFAFNGTDEINSTASGATCTLNTDSIDGYHLETADITTASGSDLYVTYNSTDNYGGYIVVPHVVSSQSDFATSYTPLMVAIVPIVIVALLVAALVVFKRE